jgi:hypothetical protein
VANEFFDSSGRFTQTAWASQLLNVLRAHGGALHTRGETYAALRELLGSLGDPYSTFLDPSVSGP